MKATIQYIEKELTGLYPISEIKGFERLIFESVFKWDFTAQILRGNDKIAESDFNKIVEIVSRLKHFEPIQYILGETHFFGLKLKVAPGVLIPRPETEELVNTIIQKVLAENSTVLDIGTGSGCIAIALKKQMQNANVTAVDISGKALEIARENASENHLDVDFVKADILSWKDFEWKNFDLIVSNPPYVRESEKPAMKPNVLVYEPPNALFVTDNDPIVFYREIALFAKKYLFKNGYLFFEINEKMHVDIINLLTVFGFSDIEAREDINGKMRLVCCRK